MIENISLTNFKAFSKVSVDFGKITLLTGINGVGKSTIIQSLCVIRQSQIDGSLNQGLLSLNGRYVELGTGRDVLNEDFVETIDDQPFIGLKFAELNLIARYDAQSNRLSLHDSSAGLSNIEQIMPNEFQLIRADRIGPATYYADGHVEPTFEMDLGPRGQRSAYVLASHRDDLLDESKRTKLVSTQERLTLLDASKLWMNSISPGVDLDSMPIENTDLFRLEFGYGGRSGISSSNRYRPTNVGFGITYALPVILACLTASKGSIVILENPEAHLHPSGQAALARLCAATAEDGVQIIVESHSDHFLNSLRISYKMGILSEEPVVNFFDRYKTEDSHARVTRVRVSKNGSLSEWPQGFFDEWDNALDRLVGP